METVDEVAFTLDRFEVTKEGRLWLFGSWTGVEGREISDPVLVVHTDEGASRLEALRGARGRSHDWSALFDFEGDPASIHAAQLELAPDLTVTLPAPRSSAARQRSGRVRIPANQPGFPDDPAPHESAWADAPPTREKAERERADLPSETSRLHEALETVKRLAEEVLEREQAAAAGLAAERAELEALLAVEREQALALRAELSQAIDDAEHARSEAARLREQLEAVRDVVAMDD